MPFRKTLSITVGVLLIAAVAAYLLRVPLSLAIARQVAAARLASNPANELPDGLHIGLCGAGSPFPDDKRAGPCTLVLAGLMHSYGQDRHYRVAHHGSATVPASGFGGMAIPFVLGAEGRAVVLKDTDLEINAFVVDHRPVHPSVGYRIVYKGRSVVLSGDTRKSAAVQREAAGVDVLVHEALSPPLVAAVRDAAVTAGRNNLVKIFDDIVDYHATPEQAAETARDARSRMLLLNHIVPALPLPGMEKAFLGGAGDIFGGTLHLGLDGDFVSLPAGSSDITMSRRF